MPRPPNEPIGDSSGAPAIELRGLTKRFGDTLALDGVDLVVRPGVVFGFLGRNGAGKTTALRILSGLARPTSGTAHILGHDVAGASDVVRAQIGFLPDVPGFYPWMTAREYLAFAGQLFGLDAATIDARSTSLLEMAGLASVTTRVGGYSRGMKQRLGIAQALINAPSLLMLDEPTSALDPIGRREVLEMVASLRGRTTVFFSTHILADVERVCDAVAILERGRVVESASIDDLTARAAANRLVVEVEGDGAAAVAGLLAGRAWLKSLETDERTLRLTVSDLAVAQREIPAAITAAGALLRRFEIVEASLEDVFVELVGGGAMTGFGAFLRKELIEIRRTWRIWVIPAMLVFFGVTSPIIAALTPALVQSMTASQPGVVIKLPSPTAIDAYAQFLKNLDQFMLIAVVITGAGVVSGERSSGTAILALTKPLSRGAFVVAKIVSQVALLVVATTLGTLACVAVTAVVFGASHEARLVTTVALWLVYAVLLIVVMTLFSAAFRSRGAAAGAGLGFFFLTLLLSNWGPMARYSFMGLMPAMRDALMGQPMTLGWPVTTAFLAIGVGAVTAVSIFERQEL